MNLKGIFCFYSLTRYQSWANRFPFCAMNLFLIHPYTKVVTLCRPFGWASIRLCILYEFKLCLLSSFLVCIKMEAPKSPCVGRHLQSKLSWALTYVPEFSFHFFLGFCIFCTFVPIQQTFLKTKLDYSLFGIVFIGSETEPIPFHSQRKR